LIRSVHFPFAMLARRDSPADRRAAYPAFFSNWVRARRGLLFGIMLSGVPAFGQIVATAYVFKYEIYSQADPAKATYNGSLLSAGFQFVDYSVCE